MKVKPGELAKVLTVSPSVISMAISRETLNKTLEGQIDLDDSKNHAWICKKLNKQGCVVPVDISTLFKATPLTVNDNNAQQNLAKKTTPDKVQDDNNEPSEAAIELKRQSKIISELSLRTDKAKASDAENKAELSALKIKEQSRELIQINPLARLLFHILSAQRTQLINMMSNLAQVNLDDIKSALINDLPKKEKLNDAEIRSKMQERWLDELSKILKNTDLELKNKIRQIKKKPNIIETEIVPETDNVNISG